MPAVMEVSWLIVYCKKLTYLLKEIEVYGIGNLCPQSYLKCSRPKFILGW